MTDPENLREHAEHARAWPFEEARKVVKRIKGRDPGQPVVFQTGYGPSGLPHIGTFGEVCRTTMVRHAFEVLTGGTVPTRLICFSDDMDGLRKVPGNVPNPDMLAAYIEVRDEATGAVVQNPSPLTSVPDPFGTDKNFANHNNARLRAFLDGFDFTYEFVSSTETYRSGRFDEMLTMVLERHDKILDIVRPLLGPERRATYCAFLPIVEEWRGERRRQVLHYVRLVEARPEDGVAVFVELNPKSGETIGEPFEHKVTGGHCKLQWRPDWALRWAALGVDYEMSGKDLIDSVKYGGRICRAIGAAPPEGFNYELFLDENGQKISKSRGNGITIDEWLRYASPESLSLYMYQAPRKAKRLHFDIIPKAVDEYLTFLGKYDGLEEDKRLESPVWHIHGGEPPQYEVPISFVMLLNLVSASNAHDKTVLWGFIRRYAPQTSPETHAKLDQLVGYAINYYDDFIRPNKSFRAPDDRERTALEALDAALAALPADADGAAIQTIVYEIGKSAGFEPLRAWFSALYEVLLGQKQGPRFGPFVALYGTGETRKMIRAALEGRLGG
ncbi:Lysyl-tRNA synthetase (class I) [hydrothermal vent metagenome]|uniref:Lysine--tRNA ligase n=1 Tax=hydrothermal vent metagenome TaxID=652676 RepID=A0A3B0T332_9ZZZZ